MEIKGKVVSVLPQQSGTSQAGNQWKKQEFVIETQEQFPKKICMTLFGDRVDQYPVAVNDEKVTSLKNMVTKRMLELFGDNVSIHDFRVVEGPTHTNVIFDIVIPFGFEHSDVKVSEMVKNNISEIEDIDYRAVIKVEHAYI